MPQTPDEVNNKFSFNKHLLVGYLFLGLVFAGAVSSVYYWESKQQSAVVNTGTLRHVGSGEQVLDTEAIKSNCDSTPALGSAECEPAGSR